MELCWKVTVDQDGGMAKLVATKNFWCCDGTHLLTLTGIGIDLYAHEQRLVGAPRVGSVENDVRLSRVWLA